MSRTLYVVVTKKLRAERDHVVGTTRASKSALWIILWVAISVRAISLEELGVISRATAPRPISAIILVGLEHCAWVVAVMIRIILHSILSLKKILNFK